MHARLSRFATPVAVATALGLSLAACGSSSSSAASPTSSAPASTSAPLSGTITVYAASSLTGTFTDLGKSFEAAHPGTTVKFSFGASSTLAQQIIQGAPADVFASASAKNMQQVTDAKLGDSPTTFANNIGEIAVNPDKASTVTSLADLAKPGVKVALCEATVPCGAIADAIFTKAGLTVKPVTRGIDVKTTLGYVTNNQADAAIVYVTDVKAAGSKVVGVVIPAEANTKTSYPIDTVTGSKNKALAEAFEAYVLSATGQNVLQAAGFASP